MAAVLMIHLLGLCLCCVHLTKQEICNATGNLTAPEIFLNGSSSNIGDTILIRCKIPTAFPFTRIIFCDNGVEKFSQPKETNKFAYNFHYKMWTNSARHLSCMYQHKDEENQVINSHLSDVKLLQVSGRLNNTASLGPKDIAAFLGFGIAPAFILLFAAVCCMLKKKGVIKWKAAREQHQHIQRSETENQPTYVTHLNRSQRHRVGQEDQSFDDDSEQKAREIFSVYTCVTLMKKQETGPSVGFHEDQEAKEMNIYSRIIH